MGAIVKYRDLPGGPTDVRLGEEISRYCLCTQCGMLSMSVYQDRHEHVFCKACVEERSFRHHRHDIFCKYEQKNVSLDEMFDANDVVTVIRDQYTFCPNEKCGAAVPLQALTDHYSGCTPRVQCSACRQMVETREWKTHWQMHSSAGQEGPTAMEANQNQWPVVNPSRPLAYQQDYQKPSPAHSRHLYGSNQGHSTAITSGSPATTNGPRPYGLSSPATPISAFSLQPQRTASASSPGSLRSQNHFEGGEATPKSLSCRHCRRPVKESNMPRHLEICSKAPQACVYCDEVLLKQDMMAHLRQCTDNPDNVNPVCTTTGAAVDSAAKSPRVLVGTNTLETVATNSSLRGLRHLEPSGPVLPTLDVSHKQMESWLSAFEEHMFKQGIADSSTKYRRLVSALTPQVYVQVEDVKCERNTDCAYECLIKALFQRRKKQKGCDMFTPKRFRQIHRNCQNNL